MIVMEVSENIFHTGGNSIKGKAQVNIFEKC